MDGAVPQHRAWRWWSAHSKRLNYARVKISRDLRRDLVWVTVEFHSPVGHSTCVAISGQRRCGASFGRRMVLQRGAKYKLVSCMAQAMQVQIVTLET